MAAADFRARHPESASSLTGCPVGRAGIDLVDPMLYAGGDAPATWRRLRAGNRLHWQQVDAERGFWSAVRFADAERVLRDHAAFTTRKGGFRMIQRERKCSSLAFAFFPQSEASCTASSSVCNRPLSMARRANAFLGPM